MKTSAVKSQERVRNIPAKKSPPLTYKLTLTYALLRYAENEQEFARQLKTYISQLPHAPTNLLQTATLSPPEGIELVLPPDMRSAMRRSQWLMEKIAQGSLPEAVHVNALLSAWAQADEVTSTRSIIFGIVGYSLPFVTLGLITSRKSTSMMVIIRDDRAQSVTWPLVRAVCQASTAVLAEALAAADNDVRNLEPDIGDWLTGDRDLSFYTTDSSRLIGIQRELSHLNIIHDLVHDREQPIVLAINPVLNQSYSLNRWNLRALEIET